MANKFLQELNLFICTMNMTMIMQLNVFVYVFYYYLQNKRQIGKKESQTHSQNQ